MTNRNERRRFEAETERILLLYHHGKINKKEFERLMAEHMGETMTVERYFAEKEVEK